MTKVTIRITKGGIYGAQGAIPIGTELTLSEEPSAWKGRYEVISGKPSPQAKPVTNPDRKSAIVEAINGLDPDADFTTTGKPDVDAINTLMPDGFDKVTAKERDEVFAEMSKV